LQVGELRVKPADLGLDAGDGGAHGARGAEHGVAVYLVSSHGQHGSPARRRDVRRQDGLGAAADSVRGGRSGSFTRNVAPPPGVSTTSTSPWCDSMMAATIASPS